MTGRRDGHLPFTVASALTGYARPLKGALSILEGESVPPALRRYRANANVGGLTYGEIVEINDRDPAWRAFIDKGWLVVHDPPGPESARTAASGVKFDPQAVLAAIGVKRVTKFEREGEHIEVHKPSKDR